MPGYLTVLLIGAAFLFLSWVLSDSVAGVAYIACYALGCALVIIAGIWWLIVALDWLSKHT